MAASMNGRYDREEGASCWMKVGFGFDKPSWLLCTIADLDERIKTVMKKMPKDDNSSHSFGARANSYYNERPQLLSCLHDLYNNYLLLADRYCQALTKNHRVKCFRGSQLSLMTPVGGNFQIDEAESIESDAESSVSFQFHQTEKMEVDAVFVDMVLKNVENDILLNELSLIEMKCGESLRKVELQKNSLDVLESERDILLDDNATLEYRVTAMVEENKGLASESLFLKRKATELARCILEIRDDKREFALNQKIEDLQGQIYKLEKKNKEYHEQLVNKEQKMKNKERRGRDEKEVNFDQCLQTESSGVTNEMGRVEQRKILGLWDKVKKFDVLLCGLKTTSL